MPRLAAFRGLRYATPPAPDLSTLFAPPYDVIGPEERRRLAAHPKNIVHLELAEGGENAPETARALLELWRRDGTLRADPAPSFYVAEQEFTGRDQRTRRRRGLFARLALEPYESGVVLPHERTLDGPRRERTRLLSATRAFAKRRRSPGRPMRRESGTASGGSMKWPRSRRSPNAWHRPGR